MNLMNKLKESAGQAGDLAGSAVELAGSAVAKVNDLLDDYKKALDVLGKFGFTVDSFEATMGVPPQVKTSIAGSVASIREAELKTIADEHKDNKLVSAILNAVVTAKGFYDRVQLKSPSVRVEVALGLLPSISVRFV